MQHQTFAHDTSRQIEARLEDDRKALSVALTALGAKFTRDALWSDAMSLIRSNSGPYTQALDRAIRANPLALAVTSAGLAWMILGRRTSFAADGGALAGTQVEAVARWEDEGGPVTETLAETPGPDDTWIKDADHLRIRAKAILRRIDAATRKNAAPSAQLAVHRADVMDALTLDVRRVLARGLDHLSDDAFDLAVAARERAYALHVETPKTAMKAVHDSPLTTAAAFAAAGAALAAVLPQSCAESQAFGGPRKHILATVGHAMHDERRRLADVVQRISEALQTMLTTDRT